MVSINKITTQPIEQPFKKLFDFPKVQEERVVEKKGNSLRMFKSENPSYTVADPSAMRHYDEAFKIIENAYLDREDDEDKVNPEVLQQALAEVNQAIAGNPDYAGFYIFRGALYVGMRKMERAEDDFTHAIVLQEDFSDDHFKKGDAYMARAYIKVYSALNGVFGNALSDVQKALDLRDDKDDLTDFAHSLDEIQQEFMLYILFHERD